MKRVVLLCVVACLVSGASRPAEAGEVPARHTRVVTARGPVHVWTPPGYDAATAGVLVYVHGYYTDVDTAWDGHGLAEQFERSGRNALVIVPEAPAGDDAAVVWPRLDELLEAVKGAQPIPRGPIVAAAHSGGFRTVVPWLASGRVDAFLLLDGMYGNEEQISAWLDKGQRQLVLVGAATQERSKKFADSLEGVLEVDALPVSAPRERVLFFRAPVGHMELVTEGRVLPSLLRLMPLPAAG